MVLYVILYNSQIIYVILYIFFFLDIDQGTHSLLCYNIPVIERNPKGNRMKYIKTVTAKTERCDIEFTVEAIKTDDGFVAIYTNSNNMIRKVTGRTRRSAIKNAVWGYSYTKFGGSSTKVLSISIK